MDDYIRTFTKTRFTPTDPKPSDINLRDISHALSLLCRANGHFPYFYSVGQHCVNCAKEAAARGEGRRVILACLLHDASEAYLSDITRPVKKYLPEYLNIEEKLQKAIYEKYLKAPLTPEEAACVKRIDDDMLIYEFREMMGETLGKATREPEGSPDFSERRFQEVEREYQELAEQYL